MIYKQVIYKPNNKYIELDLTWLDLYIYKLNWKFWQKNMKKYLNNKANKVIKLNYLIYIKIESPKTLN